MLLSGGKDGVAGLQYTQEVLKKEINFYVIYIYPLVFYMLVHNSSWLWCVVAVVCIPSGSVKKK